MKTFPQHPIEWNRTWVRIGLASILLNACGFLSFRYREERPWVYIEEWETIKGCQGLCLMLLTVTSVGLVCWSGFLLSNNAKFRDIRYGILGITVGIAAPFLWLLVSNAKPR
jgi:hypothetical protein